MDAYLWRTISYVAVFIGTALVLVGSVGTWYFGKRLEAIAPYKQPIRTATATVEAIIESNKALNTHYIDRGGYIIFGKGKESLLVMSSDNCYAKQTGENKILYRGVFNMDATDRAVGKPLYFLKETEYVQVIFLPMPKESKVLAGKAICTFNSIVQIEITIPPQKTIEGRFFARDLANVLSEFEK